MEFVLTACIVFVSSMLTAYLRAHFFQKKPSKEPELTVKATVVSKDIKPGTRQSGRSKGGFSYLITFMTEDNRQLELIARETEFGSIKEGMTGELTYKGSYFVRFR